MILTKIKDSAKKSELVVSFYYGSRRIFCQLYFWVKIFKKIIFKLLDKITNESNLMINIGGGNFCKRYWKSLDYLGFSKEAYQYNRLFVDYNFNLMSGKSLPFKNNSVKLFYSSHTLEHIPNEYCQNILNEIFRCLKKKGAVRLTMPDFDLIYRAYRKNNEEFFKLYEGDNITQKFFKTFVTHLRDKVDANEVRKNLKKMSKEEFAEYYTRKIPELTQRRNPGNHTNWWNYQKAERMLKKAGFKRIYESKEQGSKFKLMRGKGWFGDGFDMTHPTKSFFIEVIK